MLPNNSQGLLLKSGPMLRVVAEAVWGRQMSGYAPGGPADMRSATEANRLVGNTPGHPVLEVTLAGGELRVLQQCSIAVNGASLRAECTEASGAVFNVPNHCTVQLAAGSVLRWQPPLQACRAYIAVAGGWLKQHAASEMAPPGFEHWCIESPPSAPPRLRRRPWEEISRDLPPHGFVRIQAGPEATEAALEYLLSQPWRISHDSSLQGVRLLGTTPPPALRCDIFSAPVQDGSVQLTPSGPIALLRQRQTVGGYARIAQLWQCDVDVLAQFRPGENLRFLLQEPAT